MTVTDRSKIDDRWSQDCAKFRSMMDVEVKVNIEEQQRNGMCELMIDTNDAKM